MAGLAGCTVVVTREQPGELGRLIDDRGGKMLHVPLIEITEPIDGGRRLRTELDRLGDYDWLVVTSPNGADRVGAAAAASGVRLGAVGSTTSRRLEELTGRPVDLVPDRQLGSALADAFVEAQHEPQRVLLALGDRAASTLADTLVAAGHLPTTVVAYRTVPRRPTGVDVESIEGADALLLTSGSAAETWAAAMGEHAGRSLPDLVVAIGPTTADVARGCGLKISATAADHSLVGIVDELERHWSRGR